MPLRNCLSCTWHHIQSCLFPWLTEEVGPLTAAHRKLITTLEVLGIEDRGVRAQLAGAARPSAA